MSSLISPRPVRTSDSQPLQTKRRIGLGRTQKQVARKIGAYVTSVRNWEGNATTPALSFVPGIIRFLGYAPATPAASLGEQLRAWRRLRGISQEKFADLLEVDEGTVRRWEKGGTCPMRGLLGMIKRILGPDFSHRSPKISE